MKRKTDLWLSVACVLLATGIFAIDVRLLPLGVAGGVPYVAVLLIALWLPRRQHVFYAAVAVSTLTILGYFWSDPAEVPWMVLANRFLVLFAIWVTAMVVNQCRRTGETDMTAHQQLEESLRRLSKVFMDASDPIFIKDLSGQITDVNAEVEREYGWSRDELVGKSIKTVVPPEQHEQRDELMAGCLRGEEIRNIEALRLAKSGQVSPVLLTLSLCLVRRICG